MVSVGNSAYQQWKSLFDKHGMKVGRQYYWKGIAAEIILGKQHIIALCIQHSPKTPFRCS